MPMSSFPFAAAPLLILLAGNGAGSDLELSIEALRSGRGDLHVCITREPAHFPDCGSDPRAVSRTVPATVSVIRFKSLAPGAYAVAILHDENRNKRLDTVLGIPREGFGFSRNPVVRFGAPKFRQVRIDLGPGFTSQRVRMQYLL